MAPRLNKRQQREQEELLALANTRPSLTPTSTDRHESSEEESAAPGNTSFAALFMPEDEPTVGETEDEEATKPSKSSKTRKRKKKAVTPAVVGGSPPVVKPTAPSPPAPSHPKHASKKAKYKDNKKDEKNDLDKALAELSIKYPDLQRTAPSSSSDARATKLSALFFVSVSHLDAESELKKFFGSKAVLAAKEATSASSPGMRRRGVQLQTQRSQLTRPQPSWSMIKQREGLSARPLTDEETARKANGGPAGPGMWWSIEYSKRYKGVTKTFMQAVMTGDPETLWQVLQRMPWHADTLLQLAEVYRHREEYSQAVDYVSRALYAYERAFLGAFSFTNGSNRLDFDRVENRPFFLAIHRQVIDLQRRGCPRTAFEHARLLTSLEPLSDPHGAYLHLDYLCVKAGMGDWLLDVWTTYRNASSSDSADYIDPSILPGWSYARALILRTQEKEKKIRGQDVKEESTEVLRQAILEFPSIVPLLADKCEIPLSAEVRSHRAFRVHTDRIGLSPEESILHLLSHLYAQRSSPLWKPSSHAAWLSSTTNSLLSSLSAQRTHPTRDRFLRIFSSLHLRYSVYRHVFVLEQTHAQPQNRTLTAFIPPDITQGKHLACDPLPPHSALSTYDAAFFAGSEDPFARDAARSRRRTQAEERHLAQLIPDAATRAQIVAFFDQNPWLAAQLPGGVVQFVQMMENMPEDMLQELMLGAEMMREAGAGTGVQPGLADRGVMPGEMPGEDEVEVFFEAEDGGVDDLPRVQLANQDGRADRVENEEDDNENDEDEDEEEEEVEHVAPMPIRVVLNILNRLWGGAPARRDPPDDDDDDSE